jgi:hypothetical protein
MYHIYSVLNFITAACSLPWEVGNYTVCDNVDLKMVLTEFESYHQVGTLSTVPVVQGGSIFIRVVTNI